MIDMIEEYNRLIVYMRKHFPMLKWMGVGVLGGKEMVVFSEN